MMAFVFTLIAFGCLAGLSLFISKITREKSWWNHAGLVFGICFGAGVGALIFSLGLSFILPKLISIDNADGVGFLIGYLAGLIGGGVIGLRAYYRLSHEQ